MSEEEKVINKKIQIDLEVDTIESYSDLIKCVLILDR